VNALDPAGPAAGEIARLWWAMLAIAAVVFVVVMALVWRAIARRRADDERPTVEADRRATRWIVIGGAAIPTVILGVVFVLTLRVLRVVAEEPRDDAPVVEVIGKQWWWEVRYAGGAPGERFVTANEIRIPVGRPVRVRLSASDVIHSFWVPELQGKMDLIPGRTLETWMQADRAGVYRGQCAEFCGRQHAKMGLVVVAEEPARHEAWLAAQRAPAGTPPDDEAARGREAFLRNGCQLCHAVRGTIAGGAMGPDLTHVASRRTLAAGALPNTPGALMGWISDPQAVKPGTRMPRVPLTAAELQAIVRWLGTLR
jgi:cytochrome c oxidase subunit 2